MNDSCLNSYAAFWRHLSFNFWTNPGVMLFSTEEGRRSGGLLVFVCGCGMNDSLPFRQRKVEKVEETICFVSVPVVDLWFVFVLTIVRLGRSF